MLFARGRLAVPRGRWDDTSPGLRSKPRKSKNPQIALRAIFPA